jgi:hypothetical protein
MVQTIGRFDDLLGSRWFVVLQPFVPRLIPGFEGMIRGNAWSESIVVSYASQKGTLRDQLAQMISKSVKKNAIG